jgi:hypothetical protein
MAIVTLFARETIVWVNVGTSLKIALALLDSHEGGRVLRP